MVKINYEPSEVLISPREPYNKNTVWIHPMKDNVEIKIFDNGWRIIAQTKDIGLSNEAKIQVEEIAEELKTAIVEILKQALDFTNNVVSKFDDEKYARAVNELYGHELEYSELEKLYNTIENATDISTKLSISK